MKQEWPTVRLGEALKLDLDNAPMDYGPSRRVKQKNDRYHVWDYESDTQRHTLSVNPEQISDIQFLEENFEPAEFITWDIVNSPWFIPRDWGPHS